MQRCINLAAKGAGKTSPNPMVGAVLVYQDRIIGEGYHQYYGGPHAEVNCFNSVSGETKELIPHATLFVSLEPCSHFGKTPPCTDLILKNKVKHVVAGCRDPFPEVNGKGLDKLEAAGVHVELVKDPTMSACIELNKRFFCNQQKRRPFIVLKWAQTQDGYIGNSPGSTEQRLLISNEYSNRLVHKWRVEESSILVGTNTALMDDPLLTNRNWPGEPPVRLVLDMALRLPQTLRIFNEDATTIVFNFNRHDLFPPDIIGLKEARQTFYYRFEKDKPIVQQLVDALYKLKLSSVLVEGGKELLTSFMEAGFWDEIRVIESNKKLNATGLPAPRILNKGIADEFSLAGDSIVLITND